MSPQGRVFDPERNEAAAKSGHLPIKPLSVKERNMIKRKLNIQPLTAPFKPCPAKVEKRLRELEVAGHPEHKLEQHSACSECGCPNVAGLGTDHYGYGLCYVHEHATRYANHAKSIAEGDLIAQQQRHPRHFRTAADYLAGLEEEAKKAHEQYDLTAEMEQARALVNQVYTHMTEFEKNGPATANTIILELTKLRDEIANKPDIKSDHVTGLLEDIQKKLTCPFTERGSSGPVEISYASRVRLQIDVSEKLTKLADMVQKLKMINVITNESFLAWLGVFYENLKTEFKTITYTRDDGTFPILEGIGQCMKTTGNPRRGI
jgi:hypothetical protein